MKMQNESLLIIGLQNGTFIGWNLSTNTTDVLAAHSTSVSSMHKHGNFLVSGDIAGEIKVWDLMNSPTAVL